MAEEKQSAEESEPTSLLSIGLEQYCSIPGADEVHSRREGGGCCDGRIDRSGMMSGLAKRADVVPGTAAGRSRG
jgi:hypothetical protein